MYVGINLNFEPNLTEEDRKKFLASGKALFAECVINTKSILDSYLLPNGNLDGSKMQDEWFPEMNADIFLSHSHSDKDNVLVLAGILKDVFGLTSFIDSSVWGYCGDLLIQIDKKLCKKNDGYYDYHKRNYTTAHVHMMLTVALNQMIDKCECLMFVNTPNSISSEDAVSKTESAWIYAEIATTRIIERKNPRKDRLIKSFSGGGKLEAIVESIEYGLDLGHLYYMDYDDIIKWSRVTNDKHALDNLYSTLDKLNELTKDD